MKSFYILFLSILSTNSISQLINLKTNLTGKFILTCNETDQEFIELSSENFSKINICDSFEIEYNENEACIKYKFFNIDFSTNDSLSLNFFNYFMVDTIYTTSSCIDGTLSINNKELIEKNKGAIIIENLPEKIYIDFNNMKLEFTKKIEEIMLISSGNGIKFGKQWGYSKNTISRRVTYSNKE